VALSALGSSLEGDLGLFMLGSCLGLLCGEVPPMTGRAFEGVPRVPSGCLEGDLEVSVLVFVLGAFVLGSCLDLR
jgi:hypothetical protein